MIVFVSANRKMWGKNVKKIKISILLWKCHSKSLFSSLNFGKAFVRLVRNSFQIRNQRNVFVYFYRIRFFIYYYYSFFNKYSDKELPCQILTFLLRPVISIYKNKTSTPSFTYRMPTLDDCILVLSSFRAKNHPKTKYSSTYCFFSLSSFRKDVTCLVFVSVYKKKEKKR